MVRTPKPGRQEPEPSKPPIFEAGKRNIENDPIAGERGVRSQSEGSRAKERASRVEADEGEQPIGRHRGADAIKPGSVRRDEADRYP